MFGQVLVQPPSEDHWETILNLLSGRDLDRDALKDAYFRKHTHTMDELLASAQILEACAGYLYLQRLISLREDSLPQRLDEYLAANLSADLSVNALCNHFGISRSKLYNIVNEYYNMGIEQLTRKLRVDAAKKLLTQTTLPVSEVAAQVGYDDYNYFIKVFKKETDCTPSRYRKNGGTPGK
jgi:YesN/AraC family two-component response regulator